MRGTSGRHDEGQAALGAHPRRCGEHNLIIDGDRFGQGSSPQVRGTSEHRVINVQGPGLIPAGAGNIRYATEMLWCFQAHPRRCGEHARASWGVEVYPGSSPQVREHGTVTTPTGVTWGSSPQVRGTFPLQHRPLA